MVEEYLMYFITLFNMENNYYVYRHFKKNTNYVFYIGIGKQLNYLRAKTKHGRNNFWNNLVSKYGFDYQIIQDNLTFLEAQELEIFLISLYKRNIPDGGSLVNLTDGGEGTYNLYKSKESIEKWKISNKGKQDAEKNTMFGKTRGKHHLAKEVINLDTGIFYDCALDACETTTIPYSSFKCKLNGKMKNNTSFIYVNNYENQKSINPIIF